MIVAQHNISPARTVAMTIDLKAGYATVDIKGWAAMPCHCGGTHDMNFEAQLGCGPDMDATNLTDLEMAIRGDDTAAQRLGWRFLTMLFNRETPPCEQNVASRP